MKAKTTKEQIEAVTKKIQAIQTRIGKERNRLPEYSMFGDNNHAAIDAAIDVLDGRAVASDYEEYDESVHSFPEDDIEHVHQMALQAENWLDGYTNDDLFD